MSKLSYSVDIVFCIDITGSMNPILQNVKDGALRFYEDLTYLMEKKDKQVDSLRVRVVAYKDYYCDQVPLTASKFFHLPADKDSFESFVIDLDADGGGDEPESGLEALVTSMDSAWTTVGDRRRQVIILWTDASAHPLDYRKDKKPSYYPKDMPKDLDALSDMWESGTLPNSSKRLLLYAPEMYPWDIVGNNFSNVIHFPSKAGEGLEDIEYSEILNAIANSV